MAEKTAKPSDELMLRIRRAFIAHGYNALSMTTLADAVGLTRRSLYHYFGNKDDAFNALVEFDNRTTTAAALAAGQRVRHSGGSALDILATVIDARYGDLRREVNASPHAVELNTVAFRQSLDIMIKWATSFDEQLTVLILALERDGLLRLREGQTAATVARLLAIGGRGVNQTLPAVPPEQLGTAYRAACEAVLYGTAQPPHAAARPPRQTASTVS